MVDVDSLSPAEWLMMLAWEGNPPPDPAFDKLRVSPAEWRTIFPGAVQDAQTEETDDGDRAGSADTADSPAPAAAGRPAGPGGPDAPAAGEADAAPG